MIQVNGCSATRGQELPGRPSAAAIDHFSSSTVLAAALALAAPMTQAADLFVDKLKHQERFSMLTRVIEAAE